MYTQKAQVQRFLDALGKGDVEALQQLMTEDVRATCLGTSALSGTRNYADICGAAGMLSSITKNGIQFKIVSMTEEEDRVSCEAEGQSTLTSGNAYNNHYHFLFFFRDGKVYKLQEYIDTKLADAVLAPLLLLA